MVTDFSRTVRMKRSRTVRMDCSRTVRINSLTLDADIDASMPNLGGH